jgi:hypothetical protein
MSTTKKVKRRFKVCAGKKCSRCPVNRRTVPKSCEWFLKHVLETEPENIVILQGRRTGKTASVVKKAVEMADAGYDAIILVPDSNQAHRLQRSLMGTGVEILVARESLTVQRALSDRRPSAVFSDEVGGWVADEVGRTPPHTFVIGYRTA